MSDGELSAAEESIIKTTFRATMLRAADIAERITEHDVFAMQKQLLAEGVSLADVARVDRLHVAVAHLRACAEGTAKK